MVILLQQGGKFRKRSSKWAKNIQGNGKGRNGRKTHRTAEKIAISMKLGDKKWLNHKTCGMNNPYT